MNRTLSLLDGPDSEVAALIESLHRIGQRLEELTAGEVDAVSDREGRTFVLRRAQEHLRHIEAARQKAILDALPANLALLDAAGVIVSVNEAWREFGRANHLQGPGHALGVDYLAVCDAAQGEDAAIGAEVARGVRAVLNGDAPSFSIEYPCHSPTQRRWFLMKVTRLATGYSHGAVVMHVDVSNERRSEEGLRASELRFRQMSESIADVFFLVDIQNRRVLYMSPAFEAITGHSSAGVCEDPEAWYRAIHPDDRAAAREAAAAGMATGKEYAHESRFVHADGTTRWIAVRGFPVRDESGSFVRMAGVAVDVTGRKRSKEELERTHRDLLEASRRAGMAEVATNILHNVGNVLNSINVSASLALERVRHSRAQGLAEIAGLMDEHASDLGAFLTLDPRGRHVPPMLAQLSRDWLELQRSLASELGELRANVEHVKRIVQLQQGYAKVAGIAEVVDVRELVEDSLRMNADALLGAHVRIVREFADLAPVSLEKHKVLQILVNLVRNAQHACASSGRAECGITVGIAEAAGRIEISVSDTGSGIAAENLVKIFTHGFTTRKEGHGFGLHSGALAAVELGGALTARSAGPGLGATFTLDLPAVREGTASA